MKKKHFLHLLTLQLIFSDSLLSHYTLDDIDESSHVKHYNSLSSAEKSDELLGQCGRFSHLLSDAGEIVTRFELNEFVGLRLIHRHFTVEAGQVMSEGYELVKNVPSLVTEAFSVDTARNNGAVPASWIMSANPEVVQIFEASNDPAVKAGNAKLQRSPEFFDEMGSLLSLYGLNELLAIALLKRDSLVPSEGQIYREILNNEDCRSIVQVRNPSEDPVKAIRTSWSFEGPQESDCPYSWYCIWQPDKWGHYTHEFITQHSYN